MKKYFSQKICVISALLTIPSTALLCWLVMRVLYQRMPEYTEFVTGYTTWTAYYKQGDMTLANLFIGSLLGFFLLFSNSCKVDPKDITAVLKSTIMYTRDLFSAATAEVLCSQ